MSGRATAECKSVYSKVKSAQPTSVPKALSSVKIQFLVALFLLHANAVDLVLQSCSFGTVNLFSLEKHYERFAEPNVMLSKTISGHL